MFVGMLSGTANEYLLRHWASWLNTDGESRKPSGQTCLDDVSTEKIFGEFIRVLLIKN